MDTYIVTWVLSLLTLLQPNAPWKDTYPETAASMVRAAQAEPLFHGGNVPKTLAVEVALAWYESRFEPTALGDSGASLGLFQIHPGTATYVPLPTVTAYPWVPMPVSDVDVVLLDAQTSPVVALRLVRESFRICASRPWEERLAWYARGGAGCPEKGAEKSRHRMAMAERLWRTWKQ